MKKRIVITASVAALLLGACQFEFLSGDRLDADAGADMVIAVDTGITLAASAGGGLPPYKFRWSLVSQPDEGGIDISDVGTQGIVHIDSFTLEGRYQFRLRVTDATGETDASYITITVGGDLPITIDANAIAIVNETLPLAVTIDADTTGLEDRIYAWEIVSGQATLDDPAAAAPMLTVLAEEAVEVKVKVTGTVDSLPKFGTATAVVVGVENATPHVIMDVGGGVTGQIVFELLTEAAPKTCANFLRYVDDEFYDGIVWHRVVSGFVIQGGAFERQGDELVQREEGVRDPVESEAGNGESNLRGTVAMALRGTDADSGDNQFFINVGDNPSLDAGDPPFTVFARVVEGMDVVDEIAAVETGSDPSGLTDVPLEDVVMVSVRRDDADTSGVDTNGVDTNGVDTNGVDTNGLAKITTSLSAPLGLIGSVIDVTTEIDDSAEDIPESVTYEWAVTRGEATLGLADPANPTVTIGAAETIELDLVVRDEADPDHIVGTSGVAIVGIADTTPEVVIENTGQVTGSIVLELYTEEAPITCANFLRYVDDGFYDDNIWHLVLADVLIQAGGVARAQYPIEVPGARDPIPDEAPNGLLNERGMVAMALSDQTAGTAVSQFYINLNDNADFDADPAHTVFAQVIEGMDVVDQIGAVDTGLGVGGYENIPKKDIQIVSISRRE